jgi:PadR family transcriptional regulator, regulatory protein PadR
MPKGDLLGAFEQLVLVALVRLGRNAYGMRVQREIENCTGASVALGAVYATLDRLEAKGYVSSGPDELVPGRQGRARRYFRIAPSGLQTLRQTFDMMDRMREGVDELAQSSGGPL